MSSGCSNEFYVLRPRRVIQFVKSLGYLLSVTALAYKLQTSTLGNYPLKHVNEIHSQFCAECTGIYLIEANDVILSLYKGILPVYVGNFYVRCEEQGAPLVTREGM